MRRATTPLPATAVLVGVDLIGTPPGPADRALRRRQICQPYCLLTAHEPCPKPTLPSATTATFFAALSSGMVSVMRSEGGLGELLTGSTQPSAAGTAAKEKGSSGCRRRSM